VRRHPSLHRRPPLLALPSLWDLVIAIVFTALRLARYFGTSPEFWLNIQAGHDLSLARAENGKQIEAEVRAHG
jgi:hypothetical protein